MKEILDRAKELGYRITRVFPGGLAIMERATGKVVGKYEYVEDLEAALAVLPRSTPRAPAEVETVKWRTAAQPAVVAPRTCTNLGAGCLCLVDDWFFCVVGSPNPDAEGWSGCFRRAGCWGACSGHQGTMKLVGDLAANAKSKTAYIRSEGMYDELRATGGDGPLWNLKYAFMANTSRASTAATDASLLGEILGVVVREIQPGVYHIADKDGNVLAASLDRDIIRDFLLLDVEQ